MAQGPGFYSGIGEEPVEGWAGIEELETRAERAQAKLFEQQLEDASLYRQVFSSPAGQYVLNDLIQNFLVQRVVQPGDDQFAAGIRQGQQDIVHRILKRIEFANTGGGKPTGPGALPEE